MLENIDRYRAQRIVDNNRHALALQNVAKEGVQKHRVDLDTTRFSSNVEPSEAQDLMTWGRETVQSFADWEAGQGELRDQDPNPGSISSMDPDIYRGTEDKAIRITYGLPDDVTGAYSFTRSTSCHKGSFSGLRQTFCESVDFDGETMHIYRRSETKHIDDEGYRSFAQPSETAYTLTAEKGFRRGQNLLNR